MAAVRRFLQAPAGGFFLFGPRGTGKSTWLAEQFPGALRLDLLDPAVLRAYQARPERLRERIAAEPHATTVVIDEVQRAPQAAARCGESAGGAVGGGLDAAFPGRRAG